MHLPATTLTTEQLCRLQHPSGGGKSGSRLLSMYAISEVPCIVSGPAMYLFDPSGKYIAASVKSGDAAGAAQPAAGHPDLGRVGRRQDRRR